MAKTTGILAWHFLPADLTLRYTDRRVVKVGQKLSATGPLVLCENGMHGCVKIMDALNYAPGPVICRVRLTGKMIADSDKIVARSRTVIQMADATKTLRLFACWVAERALKAERKAGREPDPRSWNAIRVTRLWLNGKVDNAARNTASTAAWSAAWSAAESAASAASAAESAASAAESAWSAAESAARSAARSAAYSAAEKKLTAMVRALFAAQKRK